MTRLNSEALSLHEHCDLSPHAWTSILRIWLGNVWVAMIIGGIVILVATMSTFSNCQSSLSKQAPLDFCMLTCDPER